MPRTLNDAPATTFAYPAGPYQLTIESIEAAVRTGRDGNAPQEQLKFTTTIVVGPDSRFNGKKFTFWRTISADLVRYVVSDMRAAALPGDNFLPDNDDFSAESWLRSVGPLKGHTYNAAVGIEEYVTLGGAPGLRNSVALRSPVGELVAAGHHASDDGGEAFVGDEPPF